MPQESQLAHRSVKNTNLPYVSNVSPIDTEPHYVQGSADILTSINGYAERRPGFASNVETTPTVFNNLQRLFSWDRFDGTFFIMACDINASGFAQVFKLAVGVDASFVSIFTGNANVPFDFVVSNNTLYFSNGVQAKKWDPINGVSNWGIAIGSVNNAVGPTITGQGVNSGSGTAWTNPNNVTSITNYATVTGLAGLSSTQYDQCTQFGFSIPGTNTIQGIQVNADIIDSDSTFSTTFSAFLLKTGNAVGLVRQVIPTTNSATNISFGSQADLWGTTWVPNDINQTTFGVQIKANTGHAGGVNLSLRNVTITIYALGGPSVSVSGSAGSMTATAGYTYVFCYGNSNTGHLSSPSPISSSTGIFTNKANVSVTLTASTDPQVNQIHAYRTTDGGGGIYFELPTSPYPNTTQAITDSAADSSLQAGSIAPTPTFNDPPPPLQGMVYFSGRIWGFTGNKVWFTGLEEINQGVPEECVPSGVAGNFWSFDQPVQGLGLAGGVNNQVLAIYCGGRIYGITGNTLDTFRRFTVSKRRGWRNRTCVSELGGMTGWLDSASQVWASDGNSLEETSKDIRPDLVGLNPANCSMTFHVSGRFHWQILSTGAKLFVYDLDLDQWMPPWSFSCNYIYSGETSAGNYELLACTPTKAIKLNISAFNDNGSTYQPIIKTNLMSVVPDFGRRFSYMAAGLYDEPSRTGVPWIFQFTNNNVAIQDFLILADDDPTKAAYTSIFSNLQDTATTFNRTNGQFIKQNVFPVTQPASRWVSIQMKLLKADQADNIYEYFMAYKGLGGR